MAWNKKSDCVPTLVGAGISHADAVSLRKISMALHRWHELECGDGDSHSSWCITRGKRVSTGERGKFTFEHDESGKPFIERHLHSENGARYSPTADREAGAKKRLAAIMARYPSLGFYIQGDPRGAALYILRPGDVPNGARADSCYNRGIAVYK